MTFLKAAGPALFLAAIVTGQEKPAEENLTARIDASLTANGTLQWAEAEQAAAAAARAQPNNAQQRTNVTIARVCQWARL